MTTQSEKFIKRLQKKIGSNISKIFFLGLSLTLYSVPVMADGWAVKFNESNEMCETPNLNWVVDRRGESALIKEYRSNPQAFTPTWRKYGGFFTSSTGLPFADVDVIRFTRIYGGIREFEATFKSGLKEKGDENFGNLYLCKEGDTAFDERCVQTYNLELSCLDINNGTVKSKYLSFDSNGNGLRPQNSQRMTLSTMSRIAPSEMKLILAKFDASKATLPTRLEAQNDARLEAARLTEQKNQAAYQIKLAKQREILEKSRINTQLFCESSSTWLLAAGDPITSAAFKCDLLSEVIGLRDLIGYGWDIVSEIRTPLTTMSGNQAFQVSLRLKKVR